MSLPPFAMVRSPSRLAALAHYGRSTSDFSDCLHVAVAALAGEQPLWTFDKAASKVEGARLLAERL